MKAHLPLQISQLRISLLVYLISMAISLSAATAQVITVGHDPLACDFIDLQQAIDQAPNNARIEMAAGTYLANHVDIANLSVWISGGHDGCGGDPLPDGRSILDADKLHHVMDIGANEPIVVILDRLEIHNGRGRPIGLGPVAGGGLRVYGPVNLVLHKMVFLNNLTRLGGGLSINEGLDGRPDVIMIKSDFRYNLAKEIEPGTTGYGGGVHCQGASISIRESTFFRNVAGTKGGAIYADDCEVEMIDSHLDGNRATQFGGAIYSWQSDLSLSHVQFDENRANVEGGAMFLERTPARIFGAVAHGNTSAGQGAFLWANSFLAGENIEILSSVISGGKGKSQIYTRTVSNVYLLSSTVFNNPSPNPMLNMDDAESHVSHVIFAGNGGPPTHQDPDVFTCNFLENALNVPANAVMPFFGDPEFVDDDDHHLEPFSPAVDACVFGMFKAANEDLDGDLRPDAAGRNDIGADEVN